MGENGVSLPHWYYSMRPHLRTHTLETDDSGDVDECKINREFSSSKETISRMFLELKPESNMMIHDFALYLSVELYISALKRTITVTPEKTDFVHGRSDCTG